MATVLVDGQTIYYTRPMRNRGARVLLLIHGAGGTHLDWPREIQRFPQMDVYNLDLPGHGRSTGPGRDSVLAYATVVQRVIEELDLDDVVLIGHSMGAAVALQLAQHQLAPVSRLVLINSAASFTVAPYLLENSLAQPELAVDFVIKNSWGDQENEETAQRGRQQMLSTAPAVLHDDLIACANFDIARTLPLHVPSLVISGSQDHMTSPQQGRRLAEAIGATHLVEIEGAGHFSMLERPAAVVAAIAQFLQSGAGIS